MKKKRKDKGYTASYDNREGDSRKLIFDLPDNIPIYNIKEGSNSIIILAWEIKSKKNPMVVKGHREIGDWTFEMDVFVHMLSKPSKMDVFCLNRNYGTSESLCDYAKELYDSGKEKEYAFVKAKRRVYYWILDPNDLDKGIKFYSPGSQIYFGKELIEEANECSKGESIIDFSADGDNDIYIVKFRAVKEEIGKSSYLIYKSFRFINIENDEVDNAKDIKKAVEKAMENIVSLDSLLIVKTEDEIKKLIYLEEDNNNDDDNEEKDEKKNKKSKCDEDDDDKEEEKEEKKNKKSKSNDECPHDLVFGKDFEKEKLCNKCDLWEECCDEQAAIKKRNKK